MAFDPRTSVQGRTVDRAYSADIDAGLRTYMLRVYNYMAMGVALTGIVAYAIALNPALMQTIALGGFKWVLFIGILGLGWFSGRIIFSASSAVAHGAFWLYAGLWGALISPMVYMYTGESIARVFFITAAAFAGTSLYGYTTKRDLSTMGRFLAMSTIGILIALLLNVFVFQSDMMHLVMAIVVVLVFAGLTAYETQAIKEFYVANDAEDLQNRKSIFGAFMLYGSFVTMFVWLLSIFGSRE
ncbi:MAG: Bax inhibitor-1/YccA family protein [Pseudomonadota bacterium]